MTPDGLRDLLMMGLADLTRADELIAGVVRRREYGDRRVLGPACEAIASDPTLTALAVARKSIAIAAAEMSQVLDMQVGYLRTTEELTAEYTNLHAGLPIAPPLSSELDGTDEPV